MKYTQENATIETSAVDALRLDADAVEKMFAHHGFIGCPLERKRIVSLLARGFDTDQIYSIGCDVYCS
jgi:hypothetical protein